MVLEIAIQASQTAVPPSRLSSLEQNSPNPFNPRTKISFSTSADGPVSLRVFDLAGRHVRTLIDATMPAGVHATTGNGLDDAGLPVASGTYFYTLATKNHLETKKMVLVR